MSDSHGHPKHQYHLVDPSPWPLLGSLSAGAMFYGVVQGMHVQYKTGFVRVINNFLRECCAIASLNDYVLGSSTSSRNTIMLGVKNKEKLLHYQRKV